MLSFLQVSYSHKKTSLLRLVFVGAQGLEPRASTV